MSRLAGKVALITGASSGFGLAMAKKFASEGAKVVAVDVNPAILEIATTISEDVKGFVADVTNEDQVKAMYEFCVQKFGKLDILCNNAGISGPQLKMHEYPLDAWDKVFNVNVRGYLLVMQGALKLMLANGGGSIVNTASIGGFRATPMASAYIASKGTNVMMTKQAAVEYVKDNIRVNGIAPGIFNTAIISSLDEQGRAFLDSQVPMGRIGEPEEMANLALFLASDESSYITGQVYIIDGGRAAL